ncbi:NeuD/PglB/VioB family sugar acetyltransferase [Janibacter hoylei]|uniref:NeuD/PglB/VioB family sugar acetyltransferase n=1 Tax=Janibacter hoylei TaxID=364298 RepID=UPI002492EF4F|nr:NeuD/PglB/VioB family sugar acetyltransferase [Janibacter hoylei]
MSEDIFVVGAGGFGREVVDIIEAINDSAAEPIWALRGIVDDAPSTENLQRLTDRSIEYLGTISDTLAAPARSAFIVGVGSPAARESLASTLETHGFRAATLVHPTVTMGSQVTLGPGSVLCAGVRITTNVMIGNHVHVNLNATIGHDSRVGDFVSINPLASISGDCVVGDRALLGVCSSLINGVTVGRGGVVGAAACVVRDVADDQLVKGVPAR